jgi:hypothetical protein
MKSSLQYSDGCQDSCWSDVLVSAKNGIGWGRYSWVCGLSEYSILNELNDSPFRSLTFRQLGATPSGGHVTRATGQKKGDFQR